MYKDIAAQGDRKHIISVYKGLGRLEVLIAPMVCIFNDVTLPPAISLRLNCILLIFALLVARLFTYIIINDQNANQNEAKTILRPYVLTILRITSSWFLE